ncbi:ATP-binding cassette domain-containing protein [Aquabacterium sp.]|uniref:phosphonate ABC transporter ATP-binding protein n=1 Tax=Aquabacterium sp. TaxID=1872578 RepID=UPI0019CEC9D9|nr:ATP-binding cassette domain-containing protein [Aquabacterium sp.]MBC7699380.1 ATP-binding cassette domain-containing protein [Aquabacterium sp.]
MAPEIHLKGVSRHWAGRPTVKNVSIRLSSGERVALIGPSGGGKSTLIHLIAGALRPTEGVIDVDGRSMADFSWRDLQRYRSRCRIIEQQSLLVPQSTVHGNVLSGLVATWPWHKTLLASLVPIESARVGLVLEQLGIANCQWARVGELSGGQMQRVAIARALIADPAILLADEPTASLDPNTAKSVTQKIVELAKARSMSLVFCTHWFDIVKRDCTRVIGLSGGAVVFDCDPDEVSHHRLESLYAGSGERI